MAGMFGDAINQRADFFDQLARAQQELAALLRRLPHETPLESVGEQLVFIERWTASGRTPTLKERKSITIGLQMFKEYDASDDDGICDVRPKISCIDAYFKFWPDDKTAADRTTRNICSIPICEPAAFLTEPNPGDACRPVFTPFLSSRSG